MKRCLEIYEKILGDEFEILSEKTFCKLDIEPLLIERVSKREESSLEAFRSQFGDVQKGDMVAFETSLYTKHRLYSELPEDEKIRFYTS